MMVGEAVLTIVGDEVSVLMSMADDAMSRSMSMTGDAESMAVAGDEPSILVNAGELVETVDAGRSMVVGEGADESVDPDPIVPMVGAN
jgi:hypothetical protein